VRLNPFHCCRRIVLGISLLLLAVPAWGQDTPGQRATLQGIKAIAVDAFVAPDGELGGLIQSQLQTDVELRLQKAGIRVVSEPSADTRWSFLSLTVNVTKAPDFPVYGCAIVLEVNQPVSLAHDPRRSLVVSTWTNGSVGVWGAQRLRDGVRDGVADLVDKFINAYLEQNPKK